MTGIRGPQFHRAWLDEAAAWKDGAHRRTDGDLDLYPGAPMAMEMITVTKESLRQALAFVSAEWGPTAVNGVITTAARFVERLLPEKCDKKGCVEKLHWDGGLVEAAKQAALDGAIVQDISWDSNVTKIDWEVVARAVLSALAEKVSE